MFKLNKTSTSAQRSERSAQRTKVSKLIDKRLRCTCKHIAELELNEQSTMMETIKGGAVRLGEQLREAKKRKESCCKPPKLLMATLHMEGHFL